MSDGVAVDLYGRPTLAELVEAARDFLADDVMAATDGRVQFHARVAVRVLDTVLRELALAPRHMAEQGARLAALGYPDAWALVAAIRAGRHDDDLDGLAAALEPEVRAKLEVTDPRYLA
ncbi:MAG TPA: DUF6285 domain-containing protein [Acidimicrobiales bacterium]|nr:DUF6285 domain-containing protein [Acidimicrobiales bacterium]